ncbi:5,6-dimethylbenzimidazole synthase [Ectothiorhodospira magna]|uniref:5,6-dimethylbenzimidazole synthase n=1 Tax=Ectothiorhodospira magna TaxID=867345 RepID=A0A1H9FP18_9GAMM|nr:nitroreductase family protein [Ectothiorhodospira magna]SEQ39223.1 5,6-dimethylbenzimidazole synthase [Ectothiorhodospira magna]
MPAPSDGWLYGGYRTDTINLCITCDRDRAGPVVIGRTHDHRMDLYSVVCAVQNLWLAARSEGLGVGWVSIFRPEDIKRVLSLPENIVPVAYLCIGRVSHFHDRPELETAGWRSRLPLEQLIHMNGWGQPPRRRRPAGGGRPGLPEQGRSVGSPPLRKPAT